PDGAPGDVAAVRLSDSVRSPLVLRRRPPEPPPRCLRAASRRGYFFLISALTCPAFVVNGTFSFPLVMRPRAVVICFQTLAGMYRVLSSEIPPFESVRLYPCVPYLFAWMSEIACLNALVKLESTDESR